MRETQRLFIAIQIPVFVQRRLRDTARFLKDGGILGVKWVRPDSVHITLKFLGEVKVVRTGDILQSLYRAATSFGFFTLSVGGLDAFPSLRHPRVLCLGLEGSLMALSNLHGRIEKELTQLGFSQDGRQFRPHLTLGRVAEPAARLDVTELSDSVAAVYGETQVAWLVEEFCLIRSTLSVSGAKYDHLGVIKLGH